MLMTFQEPWVQYLIRTTTPPVWDQNEEGTDILPAFWYPVSGDDTLFLHAERKRYMPDGSPALPAVLDTPPLAGAHIIGGWLQDGSQWGTVLQEEYVAIRPLGNMPAMPKFDEDNNEVGTTRAGAATQPLGFMTLAGHAQRHVGEDGEVYPQGSNPFDLEVRHQYFEGEYTGHGWRAEMVGAAADRDPSVRAVALYSDPECTAYLYTTGAFVQGSSEWQLDDAGDPLTVWYTVCPPGQYSAEKKELYFAVLWASIQEGYQVLPVDKDSVQFQFWDKDQPSASTSSSGPEWVNTGAGIIGQAGQLFYVSDGTMFVDVPTGTPMRYGDLETTFSQIWPGTDDLIETNPYVPAQIGDAIWLYI